MENWGFLLKAACGSRRRSEKTRQDERAQQAKKTETPRNDENTAQNSGETAQKRPEPKRREGKREIQTTLRNSLDEHPEVEKTIDVQECSQDALGCTLQGSTSGVLDTGEILDLPHPRNPPQDSKSRKRRHSKTTTLRVGVRLLVSLLVNSPLVMMPDAERANKEAKATENRKQTHNRQTARLSVCANFLCKLFLFGWAFFGWLAFL